MSLASPGCQTCKIRRIKCDKAKPRCQCCVKSKRVCVERKAPSQIDFTIHAEDRFASGKIKRPRGPRSHLPVLSSHVDLETQALAYYLEVHLQVLAEKPNISGGLSACVAAWRESGRANAMVDLALSAMALAVYSKARQHPPAAIEAASKYDNLLQLAQTVIQPGSRNWSIDDVDASLLAIFLMGRYEGAVHRPGSSNPRDSFQSLQSFSHHDGAMAILKLWSGMSTKGTAITIVKHNRRGLIKSCLLRNLVVPDWMMDGNDFGEDGPELDYDRLMVRMVNLHCEALSSLQKTNLHVREVDELENTTQVLDAAIQEWAAQLPRISSYQCRPLSDVDPYPETHFYSSTVYTCSRLGYSAIWSHYFAARMLITGIHLRILQYRETIATSHAISRQKRLDCTTQLQNLADSLASTVPFCLSRVEVKDPDTSCHTSSVVLNTDRGIRPCLADLIVWPLTIASSLEGVGAEQQQWFRSELAAIGRITGDSVLECAETKQWLVL